MKFFLKMIFVGLFVAGVGYNFSQAKEGKTPDIFQANVDALANGEHGDPGEWYIVNVRPSAYDCIRGGWFSCW